MVISKSVANMHITNLDKLSKVFFTNLDTIPLWVAAGTGVTLALGYGTRIMLFNPDVRFGSGKSQSVTVGTEKAEMGRAWHNHSVRRFFSQHLPDTVVAAQELGRRSMQ